MVQGRVGIDCARQRLHGTILVGIHGRDQGFLTDLGWDWTQKRQPVNRLIAMRNKERSSTTRSAFCPQMISPWLAFPKEHLDSETDSLNSYAIIKLKPDKLSDFRQAPHAHASLAYSTLKI